MGFVTGDTFDPAGQRSRPQKQHLKLQRLVAFDRRELDLILRAYGRGVAAGEWRDYAIDHMRDVAVFSIFRHASEAPLYRIEKDPAQARAQGAYLVRAADGRILRRGRDLSMALRVIEPRRLRLIG
jgi:hypothetical protein